MVIIVYATQLYPPLNQRLIISIAVMLRVCHVRLIGYAAKIIARAFRSSFA